MSPDRLGPTWTVGRARTRVGRRLLVWRRASRRSGFATASPPRRWCPRACGLRRRGYPRPPSPRPSRQDSRARRGTSGDGRGRPFSRRLGGLCPAARVLAPEAPTRRLDPVVAAAAAAAGFAATLGTIGSDVLWLVPAQVLAAALGFGILARDLRREASGAATLAVAVAVLVGSAATVAVTNAWLFALALFPALLALVQADARAPSRRLWLAVPLLALWGNLNGSALAGLGLLAVYLALGPGRRRSSRRGRSPSARTRRSGTRRRTTAASSATRRPAAAPGCGRRSVAPPSTFRSPPPRSCSSRRRSAAGPSGRGRRSPSSGSPPRPS